MQEASLAVISGAGIAATKQARPGDPPAPHQTSRLLVCTTTVALERRGLLRRRPGNHSVRSIGELGRTSSLAQHQKIQRGSGIQPIATTRTYASAMSTPNMLAQAICM